MVSHKTGLSISYPFVNNSSITVLFRFTTLSRKNINLFMQLYATLRQTRQLSRLLDLDALDIFTKFWSLAIFILRSEHNSLFSFSPVRCIYRYHLSRSTPSVEPTPRSLRVSRSIVASVLLQSFRPLLNCFFIRWGKVHLSSQQKLSSTSEYFFPMFTAHRLKWIYFGRPHLFFNFEFKTTGYISSCSTSYN